MENIKISDTQRINLIKAVVDSNELVDILKAVEKELDIKISELDYKPSEEEKTNQVNYEPNESLSEENINSSLINNSVVATPKEASIYRENAKVLVEQDRLDHPVKEMSETEEQVVQNEVSEEPIMDEQVLDHPKVLERTINNNPWSDLETVSPGQLKL